VLGIDVGESVQQTEQFFAGRDPGYSILSDADNTVAASYGVSGLPALVVIDRQGKLRGVLTGVVSYARLQRLVAEAMAP
jgi:peroxiredoxin